MAGREHEKKDVIVMGSGFGASAVLPRAPGGPPSMTIAASANHLAERFIERHPSYSA